MANQNKGNYFIVSSRPSAAKEGLLKGLKLIEAEVTPMSPNDRSVFIGRWHQAIQKEVEDLGRKEDVVSLGIHLKKQLEGSPAVARLATNPLLCAMICAFHRDSLGRLPEREAELCESLCYILLHKRDWDRRIDLTGYCPAFRNLSYHQKRGITQDIAHYMVRNENSTIASETTISIIVHHLCQIPGAQAADASEILRGLEERSGMIRETRRHEFDFIHNSFKEFLASDRFVSDGDDGLLASHVLDSAWRPVLIFAAATQNRHFATKLVRGLINAAGLIGSPTAGPESRGNIVIALRCQQAAQYLDADCGRELDQILPQLLPPRDNQEVSEFSALGDRVIDALPRRKMTAQVASVTVRMLRLIGTEKALERLHSFKNDIRMTVASELALVLNPLGLSYVKRRLAKGESLPESIAANIYDLRPASFSEAITTLKLAGAGIISCAGLEHLQELQSLDLSRCGVVDIELLRHLTKLQSLLLAETGVTDISSLEGLKLLSVLNLNETSVTDLSPLAQLSNLTSLEAAYTGVYDLASATGV